MSIQKKIIFTGFAAALLIFTSCSTTKKIDSSLQAEETVTAEEIAIEETEQETALPEEEKAPVPVTELYETECKFPGIKIEAETLFLENCEILEDKTASKNYSIKLNDKTAKAQIRIHFETGKYECLLKAKAFYTDEAFFALNLDENRYIVHLSNPPLGKWEYTSLTPVYFTAEDSTVLITIQSLSDNNTGDLFTSLDYLQFVKIQ